MKSKFLYYVATAAAAEPALDVSAISNDMQALLASYRKIIVLAQDEAALSDEARAQANRVGQELFYENQERIARLDEAIARLLASDSPARFDAIRSVLDYVDSGEGLYDADRLAFRELARPGRRPVHRGAEVAAELCAGGEQPRLRVLSAGEVS